MTLIVWLAAHPAVFYAGLWVCGVGYVVPTAWLLHRFDSPTDASPPPAPPPVRRRVVGSGPGARCGVHGIPREGPGPCRPRGSGPTPLAPGPDRTTWSAADPYTGRAPGGTRS